MLHNAMQSVSSLLSPQSQAIAACKITMLREKMSFVVQVAYEPYLKVFNKVVHR